MLQLKYSNFSHEAGTDEAGRGCLAGPVTAAAVILPNQFQHELLNDSKQLIKKDRDYLRKLIEDKAIAFSVAHIGHQTIDQINILNASIKAMQEAIGQLKVTPDFILVDGNRFKPYRDIPFACIIKGDATFMNIAAASVLAKTYRDDYMADLHKEFPHYNWKNNKGYPTAEHRSAIEKFGVSPHHRLTFRLLPDQLELDFDNGECTY
jgi:ribonuclease HII